jgi:hypothetical protein
LSKATSCERFLLISFCPDITTENWIRIKNIQMTSISKNAIGGYAIPIVNEITFNPSLQKEIRIKTKLKNSQSKEYSILIFFVLTR